MKPLGLKKIVEQNQTTGGRLFDLAIFSLILLSIVTFSVETLPNLSANTKGFLRNTEIFVVVVFTAEYLVRFYLADEKLKYVFSFYGLIDLVAIVPFYISSGIDLRSVRVFRLLRLFRLFKLVRYSRAIQRFTRAFAIAKEEIVLFVIATGMMLFLSAVGIYYFENSVQPEKFKSVFHSLWWAVTTLTTVGYGDMFPITTGGKVFAFFVLMIGLGIVAVPAGLLASALSKARMEEQSED